MNYKKTFGIILFFGLGAFVASWLLSRYFSPPNEEQNILHEGRLLGWIHTAEKTGSVFRMKDLTDFDWDRLYIFPSHTTNEQISQEIGLKWAELTPEEQESEELCFLIFLKDGKVIQYFKYHKFYGDFSQVYQKGGYAPQEAVFAARKSPRLLHGEFPSLIIKSNAPGYQ